MADDSSLFGDGLFGGPVFGGGSDTPPPSSDNVGFYGETVMNAIPDGETVMSETPIGELEW